MVIIYILHLRTWKIVGKILSFSSFPPSFIHTLRNSHSTYQAMNRLCATIFLLSLCDAINLSSRQSSEHSIQIFIAFNWKELEKIFIIIRSRVLTSKSFLILLIESFSIVHLPLKEISFNSGLFKMLKSFSFMRWVNLKKITFV